MMMKYNIKSNRYLKLLRSGSIILIFILIAVFAGQIAPYSPTAGDLRQRLLPPFWISGGSFRHLLGTDEQGFDILSRILYGARVSLLIGFIATAVSVVTGTALGLLAGYFRGWFDWTISRFADLLLSFPFLIFAIGMMAFLGPGMANIILALSFKGWVEFFRVVRGEVMSEKSKEYVEASHALGCSNLIIMVRDILPNISHSIIVLATLRLGNMIIMEASLSFLGLGVQPPTPAWGYMIATGRAYILNAWWLTSFPGIALLILVMGINLFGEKLRDIMDPRLTA